MLSEKDYEEMARKWAAERRKYNLQYPSEDVIRFIKKFGDFASEKTIVDYGCGSGRNTKLMRDMGFGRIIAVDANQECLDLTKENLGDVKGIEYIHNKRMELPIEDSSVDMIVALGVLYFFTKSDRMKILEVLKSKLKPGGVMIATYRSLNDSQYGKGEEIEPNTFIFHEESGILNGIMYWFCNDKELKDLYEAAGFKVLEIQKNSRLINNFSYLDEQYVIWVQKE